MSNTMLRIGVIGTGGMGGRHARNLAQRTPGVQVVAVMDIDRARAETVAEECNQARAFTDAHALIADADVDAVVVASPDATHAKLALACIQAGKAVLCEKPLATNLDDAREVLQAETKVGRRLIQVGFMREYDPAHRQIERIVRSGEIGRPLLFRGLHTNVSTGQPRTVEDVIGNSAIHDIHSARWFLSDEVIQVYARHLPASPQSPESCRLALLQLTFAGGGLAIIEMNADAGYGYEVSVDVVGETGSAGSDGLSAAVIRRNETKRQIIDPDWLVRFDAAYMAEVQAWTQAVRNGSATGPSTWDGYTSLVIADACVRSALSGLPQPVSTVARPALYERAD